MSRGAQLQISKSRGLPKPNHYVSALLGELSSWAVDEERAEPHKGQWREQVFKVGTATPLDLEIGTGNGVHFAWRTKQFPERQLIGIELKYKPLIQSIRRALRYNQSNGRMVRYNAALVDQIFSQGELDDVYIHFPDPWSRLRQHKHRLIQAEFLSKLYLLQKAGSRIEFKTDSRDYFDWCVDRFKKGPYQIERLSYDLHNSEWASENYVTHFESIFLKQKLPIHYALLRRPN